MTKIRKTIKHITKQNIRIIAKQTNRKNKETTTNREQK